MDEEHPRAGSLRAFSFQRLGQPLHRRGHGGRHRAPGLALHQRHRTGASGHEEIHFQALLVAKIVELAPISRVRLPLRDLRRDEALEERTQERRLRQLRSRVDPEQTAIARYQASRFSQRCRVFAPMYRQLTLTGISQPALPRSALELAYGDVAAAWREYMKRYNTGRGVVLIGHSQGTGMLTELIREKIDRFPAARERLVSALLLGGNVTVKQGSDVGGAFNKVPACRSKKQRHCVVAYSTFNEPPPDAPAFGKPSGALVDAFGNGGRADTEVLCNNPAALGGGVAPLRTLVPTSPFPGTIGLGVRLTFNGTPPTAATPWVQPQDHYTGICQSSNGANVLMVSPVGSARTLVPVPDPTWGLHLADVNIALGDLVGLVRSQSRSYLKARAKQLRRAAKRSR